MVEAACHRCGREWNYTGQSEHYGTCPNCKTSVQLHPASEGAEPSKTAEPDPDPSERTVEVEVGGEESREMPVSEAVEALSESVTELFELEREQSGTFVELTEEVEEREEQQADLRAGLEELAGYFSEMIEASGGEVEYDHIDTGEALPELPEPLEEMGGSEA